MCSTLFYFVLSFLIMDWWQKWTFLFKSMWSKETSTCPHPLHQLGSNWGRVQQSLLKKCNIQNLFLNRVIISSNIKLERHCEFSPVMQWLSPSHCYWAIRFVLWFLCSLKLSVLLSRVDIKHISYESENK